MSIKIKPSTPTSGIVMLFCGDGWGKSSAALGYAMRAAGHGWPTVVVQFVKGGAWNAAEAAAGTAIGIDWPVFTSRLTWGMDDPIELCRRAWTTAMDALDRPGLVVLDELTHAVEHGWLDIDEITAAIADRHPLASVIVTGRTAQDELIAAADTVTAFDLVKHDSKKGILAP